MFNRIKFIQDIEAQFELDPIQDTADIKTISALADIAAIISKTTGIPEENKIKVILYTLFDKNNFTELTNWMLINDKESTEQFSIIGDGLTIAAVYYKTTHKELADRTQHTTKNIDDTDLIKDLVLLTNAIMITVEFIYAGLTTIENKQLIDFNHRTKQKRKIFAA